MRFFVVFCQLNGFTHVTSCNGRVLSCFFLILRNIFSEYLSCNTIIFFYDVTKIFLFIMTSQIQKIESNLLKKTMFCCSISLCFKFVEKNSKTVCLFIAN